MKIIYMKIISSVVQLPMHWKTASISNGGLPAQQIMNRDGGLKLRIDDFDYVQGKSANWVSSLNFNTSLTCQPFSISRSAQNIFRCWDICRSLAK